MGNGPSPYQIKDMKMKYKILSVAWRSGKDTVGFVAYDTENPTKLGEWNSVVGWGYHPLPSGGCSR